MTTARRRRRTHFIFFPGESPVLSRGLDPSILRSLPITVYRPSDFQEGLECAVCISEIAEGEEARLLPKCNHGFHLECIDMWFHSHSTCPLCRCPVIQEVSAGGESTSPAADDEAGHDAADSHIPENVQSLRNQEQDNNGFLGSERVLVISIPLRTTEGMFKSFMSPLQSSRVSVQDRKSPVEEARSPAASRLGSFKRLLSRGKRNAGSCSSSPKIGDIEQGMVGSLQSN
ncbi:hypothetical protein HPP92_010940 [Vanilla planifolia]|nr:hypothetical protein HPP92_010940 [Vanilla planifolia]